jgi:NTP pyrophosphatase (non-canonical NTP hydrolase)
MNQYGKNIIRLLRKQNAKGLKKYGVTLEANKTLSTIQRIEHLQEELIDGLQYCEHLKASYKDNLTANDYQRMAMRTAGNYNTQYDMLRNAVYGLNGESGEVIDILKKHEFQGHELDYNKIMDEAGDVCWYLALLASALNVPLEAIMLRNVQKLMERYPDGFDKNRSIHRVEK